VRTVALVLEYDGSDLHGFQRQDGIPTVAGEMERALETLCGQHVDIVGAGRTDAGVHATGQVVSFETESNARLEAMPIALSGILRASRIAVVRAVERAPGFSARRSALSRTYRYRILNRAAPSPLLDRRAFYIRSRLDVELMHHVAQTLLGEHGFAAFCGEAPESGRYHRKVKVIAVQRVGDLVDVVIEADSFLHQMARIIVGTLIEIGRGKRPPDDMSRILASGDRTEAGHTAPAHGLYLEHVLYDPPV
jgi:tRNA pseudouridine38-40 synthase